MSYSDYAEAKIIDHSNGKTAWTMPAIFVALYTAAPTDAGGGTEVTGGSYARKSTLAADWSAAATGAPSSASNAAAITFVTATAAWGTVTHFGLFDAATVGNLIRWAPLTTAKTISSGDTASFAIGALVTTLD